MVIESFGFASVLPASKVKKKCLRRKRRKKATKEKRKHLQSISGVEEHPHIWVISVHGAQYVEAHSSVFQ